MICAPYSSRAIEHSMYSSLPAAMCRGDRLCVWVGGRCMGVGVGVWGGGVFAPVADPGLSFE